jgi:NAD(P)-dependent dehydrogenase (short-subunit alcohol dehydrogenase family)
MERFWVLLCKVVWGVYLGVELCVLSVVFGWLLVVDTILHYVYTVMVDHWAVLRYELRGKHVFISGCSSGFGLDSTIQLAKKGVFVHANVRSKQGEIDLVEATRAARVEDKVFVYVFDVSDENGVAECKEQIEKRLNGAALWAVVNNAGIPGLETFAEGISMSMYRKTIEVNLVASFNICKQFLPLIRRNLKESGRIINISSVSGRVADRKYACYAASKYGLEGFTDSLRRELISFGVEVVILEPSFFKTKILAQIENDFKSNFAKLTVDQQNAYQPLERRRNLGMEVLRSFLAEDSSQGARDIVRSIEARWPERRAYMGLQSFLLLRYPLDLPSRILDWILYLSYK